MDLATIQKKWSASTTNVAGIPNTNNKAYLEEYMDGQGYTDLMYQSNSNTTYAAGYARSRKITIGEKEYVGYVGSTGEWIKIMEYDADIIEAFNALSLSFSGSTSTRTMLTSCQYSDTSAWIFTFTASGFSTFGGFMKTSNGFLKVLFKYE